MSKMEDENIKELQSSVSDFFDGNLKLPNLRERKRRRRKHLVAKARRHLKECFQLLIDSADKNFIRWEWFLAFFSKVCKEMEENGICYFKKLPNGKKRIFKELYCCETLEDWKKCPEYHCPIWPCERSPECPYHPREHKPIEVIEVTYQEPEQGRYRPVGSV